MEEELKYFLPDCNKQAARVLAQQLVSANVRVKAIGEEVLASLDKGGVSFETYDKIARMCHNRNVDNRRNVKLSKELSNVLFGRVIEIPSRK